MYSEPGVSRTIEDRENAYGRLIKIAIALASERDVERLLDRILTESVHLTDCGCGAIYILEGSRLVCHSALTRSPEERLIRRDGEARLPSLPLTPDNVCARAALEGRLINLPDVYAAEGYDFSAARADDARRNTRTRSMLAAPMADEAGHTIGVLQLVNALENGEAVPFDPAREDVIRALAALAAVSLDKARLNLALSDLLHSFVTVMVDAIDARSPYNAAHTRTMVRCATKFLQWRASRNMEPAFTEDETDAFLMSVWLHDLGKLVIPLEIMDKPTRLGRLESGILHRIEVADLMEQLNAARDPGFDARPRRERLAEARKVLLAANTAPRLTEDMLAALEALRGLQCLNARGEAIPLLTPEEYTAITVQRGTLTPRERSEMERHVVYTGRLLSRMRFSGVYADVPSWAAAHHELLDGSGYPDHLTAPELPFQVRLMTILDIYDALTADDRPYKPPFPADEAFVILRDMAQEGKLDPALVDQFIESGAWRR